MLIKIGRIGAGIVAGILATTFIVETIEFGLVTLANGGTPALEPEQYLGIRNQTEFLHLKLVYNALGGVAAGWLAAWISSAAPFRTGVVVAALQAVAFVWAMNDPALAATAPAWAWRAFAITTCAGIVAGACVRALQSPNK